MHQPTSDVQIALAEIAGALESLMARESSALRDGLVNANPGPRRIARCASASVAWDGRAIAAPVRRKSGRLETTS